MQIRIPKTESAQDVKVVEAEVVQAEKISDVKREVFCHGSY